MSEKEIWPEVLPGRPMANCGWCGIYPMQIMTKEHYPRCWYCANILYARVSPTPKAPVLEPSRLTPVSKWAPGKRLINFDQRLKIATFYCNAGKMWTAHPKRNPCRIQRITPCDTRLAYKGKTVQEISSEPMRWSFSWRAMTGTERKDPNNG